MKGLTLLAPILVLSYTFVGFTNAGCTAPVDTDAELSAAGYTWDSVGTLRKVAQGPEVTEDLYSSDESSDGHLNLAIQVSVPRSDSHSPQGLSLSNGFTVNRYTGEKISSAYRITFDVPKGLQQWQDVRSVSYLLKDNDQCSFRGVNAGFNAEDLRGIAVDRLVKLNV